MDTLVYKTPDKDIFSSYLQGDPGKRLDEAKENARRIIETYSSFGVAVSVKGIDYGPRVTRFEIVPARGVKVNRIVALFDDIMLALSVDCGGRMEAPMPGRASIAIEIPTAYPETVGLGELVRSEEFGAITSKTAVAIGKDLVGTPVFGDIAKFPHAIIGGGTGMGKSVCINSILASLLCNATPDDVRFILIDPKAVELDAYSGIPHLLAPVITDVKSAASALLWANDEMERRYSLIEEAEVRNLDAYNAALAERGEAPLSRIIIVINELYDLMVQAKDPTEDLIMRLAQKARAAGIHLIIATQKPGVRVITGPVKANIGTRIAFKVASSIDSRTLLDMRGAEALLSAGDMLYKSVTSTSPVRLQGAFISDDELSKLLDAVRCGEVSYDPTLMSALSKGEGAAADAEENSDSVSEDEKSDVSEYINDSRFLDAVEIAIRVGSVSPSLLQRKLEIGVSLAARYIDAMETLGIVDGANGQKPRNVLIDAEDWQDKLDELSELVDCDEEDEGGEEDYPTLEEALAEFGLVKGHADEADGSAAGEPKNMPLNEFIEKYKLAEKEEAEEANSETELFIRAVELVIEADAVSTSLIQRKLRIGFSRAAKIIDNMENIGIISALGKNKKRSVLITKEAWQRRLERIYSK